MPKQTKIRRSKIPSTAKPGHGHVDPRFQKKNVSKNPLRIDFLNLFKKKKPKPE